MSAAQNCNDEWNALTEEQRNCLKWPDFLQYGNPREVEIRRSDKDSPLGLVTIAVQDPETNVWYNITKKIKENHPAHGIVGPYEWIVDVDGKRVENEGASLSDLIKNGKNVVRLSLREAVDPLNNIAREWGEEKDVTLSLTQKEVAFELAHFYSKEENGNIKDRILVWDVKKPAEPETSEPLLNKGDELLTVNDEPVEGKKLAKIFELIYRDPIPGKVNLKIKTIVRRCNVEEPDSIAVAQNFEEPKEPDLATLQESTKSEFNGTQLIVVEKETNANAGRENANMRREVYQNFSILEKHESGCSPLQESEPESSKDKAGLIGGQDRFNWRTGLRPSKGSDRDIFTRQTSLNKGYVGTPNSTPETTRKFSTPDKMCRSCVSTGENRLPDARDEWPIDRIETGCFHEICESLCLDEFSKEPLLSALGCFKHKEGLVIKKNNTPTKVAEVAIIRWGTSDRHHNVGALKKILKDTMLRDDVIQVFEKWEKMSVCHGCGVKFSKP